MTVFGDIFYLLLASEIHREWSVAEVYKFIFPPLELGQYEIFKVDGQAAGFVTWAFLTDEAAEGYVNETRKLQPDDWNAGDRRWVIDLVAPFGNASEAIREFRRRTDAAGLPRATSKNVAVGRQIPPRKYWRADIK